jgi:hypothetical protein
VDDKHLHQRLARTETPTRGRPVRPIRFTPARTEPIAPPPVHADAANRQPSLLARISVWILVAAGWAVFIAWWVVVLQRESMRSLGFALGILAATIIVSAVATALWTQHNIRIARKGKRGNSSMYIPMVFERDTLGRSLALPEADLARSAAEVRVVLRDGVKLYVAPDEGGL